MTQQIITTARVQLKTTRAGDAMELMMKPTYLPSTKLGSGMDNITNCTMQDYLLIVPIFVVVARDSYEYTT